MEKIQIPASGLNWDNEGEQNEFRWNVQVDHDGTATITLFYCGGVHHSVRRGPDPLERALSALTGSVVVSSCGVITALRYKSMKNTSDRIDGEYTIPVPQEALDYQAIWKRYGIPRDLEFILDHKEWDLWDEYEPMELTELDEDGLPVIEEFVGSMNGVEETDVALDEQDED